MARSVSNKSRKKATKKPPRPTNIASLDALFDCPDDECTISAYVRAAAEYVRRSGDLNDNQKKAAQIRLSNALARAFVLEMKTMLPEAKQLVAAERKVAGALRTVNADVSQMHELDGLRLAVELKPVNLAVGRAIWNRFGDIRTFAVNLHLKFPFCVVGGVLAIPTYEAVATAKEIKEELDRMEQDGEPADSIEAVGTATETVSSNGARRKSTIHLIDKAVSRLIRAGGRKTEGDAAHLLEAIAVIVYDPDTGLMHADLPARGSSLRWDEFIVSIANAYKARFEG